MQAIKGSACETSDINAAGAVLVYDYCLYIRWLGMVHNAKDPMKLRATPGDLLLEVRLLPSLPLCASFVGLHLREHAWLHNL